MPKSVEEILSGNTETVETPEPVAATEAENVRPRDEKGRFASKAESPPADVAPTPEPEPEPTPQQPVDPDSDPKNWTYAAYRDEKTKRQREAERARAAEMRAQQLEARLQEFQSKQTPPPDQFADPEAYNSYWEQRLQQQERTFNDQIRRFQVNLSMKDAHRTHKEVFEQAYQALIDLAESGDRGPINEVLNSSDPGERVVSWFKAREIVSDPDGYRSKLEEELRAKLMAELQPQPQQVQPKPTMPSNLAAARSVGNRSGPEWSGPRPLADILSQRK